MGFCFLMPSLTNNITKEIFFTDVISCCIELSKRKYVTISKKLQESILVLS